MRHLFWLLTTSLERGGCAPIVRALLWSFLLYQSNYAWILLRSLLARVRRASAAPRGPYPSALVVLPTLMRTARELEGLKAAIGSVVGNGYPGPLTVVAAIDDGPASPALLRAIQAYAASLECP